MRAAAIEPNDRTLDITTGWPRVSGLATCNDEVAADGAGDTDADVIMSGRESRRRPWRRGPLIWLLVIAETAALAVSVAIAVHGGDAGDVL